MGLGVSEIRARAERLKEEIARERYAVRAGLKRRPAYASLYETHDLLLGEEAIPAIQRELAEATGEERRRLCYLLAWVAERRVEAAIAPLEDEFRAWEAGATVPLDGREIPFRRVARVLAEETNRGTRVALERARGEALEEALALQIDLVHREREAVASLGMGSFLQARERLSGMNVRGLERQAVRILTETDGRYRELLRRHLRERLGLAPEQATVSDLQWLGRMPELDGRFALIPALHALEKDLRETGLPLEAGGRVRLDLEDRPLRWPDSFSIPLRIPDEIVLGVTPTGGWADSRALLHETGHALHFAHTDRSLPFEYRALGDTSVTEAFALLFELLTLEPEWVRRYGGLSEEELASYRDLAGFLTLYELRRGAARLLYEVELWESDRPSEMAPRYAELLGGATGVRHEPRTFLEHPDPGFWVARQLRAWMLWAVLRPVIRERYGDAWYRNPAAGPYLCELFSGGQREDAGRLAIELGAERLRVQPLLAAVSEWWA